MSMLDIKKDWEEAYEEAWAGWQGFQHEAELDYKFYTGSQWSPQQRAYLENLGRTAFVLNKLRRVVKLVAGYEKKNRLSLKVDPIEGSDEKAADQFSGIMLWQMQSMSGYHTLSDAFERGPAVTGINYADLFVDRNGDIQMRRSPYNKILPDPLFTKIDLSDAGFYLRRDHFTAEIIQYLLPMLSERDLKGLPANQADGKFPKMGPKRMSGRDIYTYDEFWRRTTKKVKMLIDPNTGDEAQWKGDAEDLKMVLESAPHLKVYTDHIPTVELCVFVEGEKIWGGKNPTGLDDFNLTPLIGYYEPEIDDDKRKLSGIIRALRDPQTEYNKRCSQEVDIIESRINTGWIAKHGSLINPNFLYRGGQGGVGWAEKNANVNEDFRELHGGDIPPGYFQARENFDKNITEISGANDEIFGTEEKDIPGILSRYRQGAALTLFQDLFDNNRLSKKIIGKKIIKLIQLHYGPEKIQRILGEQPVREFYTKDFGKYDCTPQEGILTDTQRQMYYAELKQLKAEGAPIPWAALLDAMPMQMKDRLRAVVQQQEKGQAEAAQLEQQDKHSLIELQKSMAIENIAQAQERRSKSALDQIKTAAEIRKMDDESLMNLVSMARDMAKPPAPAKKQPAKEGITKR